MCQSVISTDVIVNSGTRRNAVSQLSPSDKRLATKNGRSPGATPPMEKSSSRIRPRSRWIDSRPKRTSRLSNFDAWRSPSSRTDGPRSMVTDATMAATSRAMAIVIVRTPKRTAQCARRRARNFTG